MIVIRVALAVFASAVLAAGTQPAAAEIYRPWCVQYGGNDGDNGTTCAFTSFEQCMMTARGGGGSCVQNPWYLAMAAAGKAPKAPARATAPSDADAALRSKPGWRWILEFQPGSPVRVNLPA
jgi:hypothetical protein